MYLSKSQVEALHMALEAMDYRNGGGKDEEQEKNYETILNMLESAQNEKKKRKNKRKLFNK